MSADQNLINTEVLRRLIREELRAMQVEGPEPAEKRDGDEELNASQAARIKGVTPRTVRDWAKQGRIRHHRTPSGHPRFYRRHVDAPLAQV